MDKEISSKDTLLIATNYIEEDLLHDDQRGAIIGDRSGKVTEIATLVFNKTSPVYKKN